MSHNNRISCLITDPSNLHARMNINPKKKKMKKNYKKKKKITSRKLSKRAYKNLNLDLNLEPYFPSKVSATLI